MGDTGGHRRSSHIDFVRLCVFANMPRLLQTLTDRLIAIDGSTTEADGCQARSGGLWHLWHTLKDGKSLQLARILHGKGSAIAQLLTNLTRRVEQTCGFEIVKLEVKEDDYLSCERRRALAPTVAYTDSGGWPIIEGVSSEHHRCDAIEVPSLPDHDRFEELLLTAKPFVIRGNAAAEMGLTLSVSAHVACH